MDVSQFIKQLSDLAEKSPEARAFISVFMLELILLVAFVAYAAQRLLRRRHADEADDADVTAKDTTISTLAKILDKTTELLDRIDQKIDRVDRRGEQLEAGVAGISATTTQTNQAGMKALETDDVLITLMDRIDKRIAAIRTRDEADVQNQDIKGHVDTVLQPLSLGVQVNQDKLTAIGANVEAVKTAVADLPPRLDALITKVDKVPEVVRDLFKQEYLAVVSERNAEREQKEQAQAALATFQKQNAELTGQVMARDMTIAEQAALIADLREIAAKHKLAETTAEAVGLPPVAPKPNDSPAVQP